MLSGAEVFSDGAVRRTEPLGVPCRLKSLHPPFPLAGRLAGVSGTVIQIALLAVLHARQDLPLRRSIAFQRNHHDDTWRIRQALEQLTEELFPSHLIPPALHENRGYVAVLSHRAPQMMPLAVDGENHLVEMPFAAWTGTAAPELIGIPLPKFATPLPDGLVGHDDAANEQEFLRITIAQVESVVKPDAVTDDLRRKVVASFTDWPNVL
jgi:hypothetical protein